MFVLAGCGGGGTDTNPTSSNPDPPPASPAPSPPPAAPGQFIVLQLSNSAIHKYDLDNNALTSIYTPSAGQLARGFGAVLSPDGNWVAYTVYDVETNSDDLYIAATDGTGVTRIPPAPAQSASALEFVWAPDSSTLAYRAYVAGDGIYLVDPDGTNHRKISPEVIDPNDPDVSFSGIKWSPDGRYVAYRESTVDASTRINVHDMQADDAESMSIEPGSTSSQIGFSAYDWAPDSSRIAYRVTGTGVTELYTVRPDASDNIKVSVPLVAQGAVIRFEWSSDSSRLLYVADANIRSVFELYTVAPDGTGTEKINAPLTAANARVQAAHWSPDGSRIAYLVYTGTARDFYTARPDGTDSIKIDVPVNTAVDAVALAWSPDSSRIAYHLGRDDQREIHTIRPDGTDNQKLTGVFTRDTDFQPCISKGCVDPYSTYFAWSADGSQLAYVSVQDAASMELFTVRPQTGEYSKLNNPLAANRSLRYSRYSWSEDATRMAYLADEDGDGIQDLYVTGSNGAGNTNVSSSITAVNRSVSSFVWSPQP